MPEPTTSKLLTDATAISSEWLRELNLRSLIEEQLKASGIADVDVDVVAIGKAAIEMATATSAILGTRVLRRLVICDEEGAAQGLDKEVVVGEHPTPGAGSLQAGRELLEFLSVPTSAQCTLFLLSGGASSLCALPETPLTLEDMRGVWAAALTSGIDITTLNKLRAATSAIAGGGVLRHVRTARSQTLIMVDNIISGARWVGSGLTYDYAPGRDEFASLLRQVGLAGSALGDRLFAAFEHRSIAMATLVTSVHENSVIAEPGLMLSLAVEEARRRGYRVVQMGSHVHGDVAKVTAQWRETILAETQAGDPVCVIGAGEVTVKVRGTGAGGRGQEFAWSMASVLAGLPREGAFVARASDGRDFVAGVGGAWVDRSTIEHARQRGFEWSRVLEDNDTNSALQALGQVLAGGHTGWNLCDLYVALIKAAPSV